MSLGPSTTRDLWIRRALMAGAIGVYLLGYAYARDVHLIVHSVAYVGGQDPDGPIIAEHDVEPGDFGVPLLSPIATLEALLASIAYWPVRKAELVYWHIAAPTGSPYHGRVDPPPDYDAIFGPEALETPPPE